MTILVTVPMTILVTVPMTILQKGNRDKIVDYIMNLKDKIELEELRFY